MRAGDSSRQSTNSNLQVLALSDAIVPFIYSPQVKKRFKNADFIIGCGDLPYYYLEYVLNALDKPLFFVRGNHDKVVEYSVEGQRVAPGGATNLHRKIVHHEGVILAGVEGCLRYRPGPYMYSQAEMWRHVISLIPGLFYNRASQGRFLDVFVTHAPPSGIHDLDDYPHRGIQAFRWFIRLFKPEFHLHGHVHIYRPDTISETRFGSTNILNVFSYREVDLGDQNKTRGQINSTNHS